MNNVSGKSYRPPIPDLCAADNVCLTTAIDRATALNKIFVMQTELPDSEREPDSSDLPINPDNFPSLSTTPAEVYKVLSSLSNHKAPELDGITTGFLKCARGSAPSLAALFNRSFNDGVFPTEWNVALPGDTCFQTW